MHDPSDDIRTKLLVKTFAFTLLASALMFAFPALAAAQSCTSAQIAPCGELKKTFDTHCASSMPNASNSPEWWFERVQGFAPAYAQLMKQKKVADRCASCQQLYGEWERTCNERKEMIASEWADYVSFAAESSEQFQRLVEKGIDGKRYPQLLHSFDDRIAELESILDIGKTLSIKADTGALEARITALKGQRAKVKKLHEEQIASVRCPRKGKSNADHKKTVQAFLAKDPEHHKDVVSLRIAGKSASRYVYPERTTYETRPVTVCARDPKPKDGPRCYVWEMSVQRTKIDGSSWSGWDTVLVGSQKEMLCRNLK